MAMSPALRTACRRRRNRHRDLGHHDFRRISPDARHRVRAELADHHAGRQVRVSGERGPDRHRRDSRPAGSSARFLRTKGPVRLVAASARRASSIVSSGDDGWFSVWRWPTGQLVRTVKVPPEGSNPEFAADIRRQAVLDGDGAGAKALKLWDLQSGRLIRAFDDKDISRIGVTPDGRKAITASVGRKLQGLGPRDRQEARHHRQGIPASARGLHRVSGRPRLAQGSIDNEITIVDLETGKTSARSRRPAWCRPPSASRPMAARLAWASEGKRLTLWDLHTAQPVRRLEDAPDELRTIAFTPDGAQLLGVGGGIPFTVWDMAERADRALVWRKAVQRALHRRLAGRPALHFARRRSGALELAGRPQDHGFRVPGSRHVQRRRRSAAEPAAGGCRPIRMAAGNAGRCGSRTGSSSTPGSETWLFLKDGEAYLECSAHCARAHV